MRRKTQKEFINQARVVHNDKYDYVKVNYINTKTKVKIICPVHGIFIQDPKSHLNGSGCMKCYREEWARRLKYNTSDFIKLATTKHNNKYEYSKVNYINSNTKVTIICPLHGDFDMLPSNHIATGQGCPTCGYMISGMRLSQEKFIERANKQHNNRFDYSLVLYKNGNTPVTIVCPEHGEFEQRPVYHISNTISCPECVRDLRKKNSIGSYSSPFIKSYHSIKNKSAILYVVNFYNQLESFIKIGITTQTLASRFSKMRKIGYNMEPVLTIEYPLYSAFIKEQKLILEFNNHRYKPRIKFDGCTECFCTTIKEDIINSVGQLSA